MQATVQTYDGTKFVNVTGNVVKRYGKGLTIEDKRGVIYYATFDKVNESPTTTAEPQRDTLW